MGLLAFEKQSSRRRRIQIRHCAKHCLQVLKIDEHVCSAEALPQTPPLWFKKFFYKRYMRAFVKPEQMAAVRTVHENGYPIYVLNEYSSLDALGLQSHLEAWGLRPIFQILDWQGTFFQPLGTFFKKTLGRMVLRLGRGRRSLHHQQATFKDSIRANHPLAFFLRHQNQGLLHSGFEYLFKNRFFQRKNKPTAESNLEKIIAEQKRTETPFFIIPVVPFWEYDFIQVSPSFLDILFGNRLSPSIFRRGFQILFSKRKPQLFFLEAINLKNYVEANEHMGVSTLARQLCFLLKEKVDHLQFLFRGPKIHSQATVINNVLKDKLVISAINRFSKKQNQNQEETQTQAKEILREMAGSPHRTTFRIFEFLINYFIKKHCTELHYGSAHLPDIQNALKKGTVVLVPNHRSHFDYFLISYILYQNQIPTPMICAGDNLNFWPIGPLFKYSGAYFIRRTFDESTLYPILLKRYLKYLQRNRIMQEIFIEGGRSRTGRMRPPMLGLLSILLGNYLDGSGKDLIFVPVALSYERVIEEKAYVQEMLGGSKRPETMKDLLDLFRLRKIQVGKIYVNFGAPVSCNEFIERNFPEKPLSKKKLNLQLGDSLARAIQKEMTITPSNLLAMILIAQNVISFQEVKETSELLLEVLENAIDAPNVEHLSAENLESGLMRAIDLFVENGILRPVPGTLFDSESASSMSLRVNIDNPHAAFLLDYYRNGILHYFLAHALVATIMMSSFPKISRDELLLRYERLKKQFSFDFPVASEISFAVALNDFLKWKMIERVDGPLNELQVSKAKPMLFERMCKFHATIQGLLECHFHTADTVRTWYLEHQRRPTQEKSEDELVAQVFRSLENPKRIESRSRFNVINALHQFDSLGFFNIQTRRSGRKIFRVYQLKNDFDLNMLDELVVFLYDVCFIAYLD